MSGGANRSRAAITRSYSMAAGESCCSKTWPPASGSRRCQDVRRAALPLRLLLPRRCLAPRRPRGDGARARILRPRAHGPQRLVRLNGVRAGSEAARPPGDHRCRSNARRRGAPDAARRDAAGICEPVPVADRDTSRARRPPRPAARVRVARGAAGRADRALGRPAGRPAAADVRSRRALGSAPARRALQGRVRERPILRRAPAQPRADRKSTRLNSSHTVISYAVFCLKKKKKIKYEYKKIKKIKTKTKTK